jgi:hypothetical protein
MWYVHGELTFIDVHIKGNIIGISLQSRKHVQLTVRFTLGYVDLDYVSALTPTNECT